MHASPIKAIKQARQTLKQRQEAARALSEEIQQPSTDEDITLTERQPSPPPPPNNPTMSSAFSLRSAAPDSDAPIWTHTSNTAVNHELDSLRIMWCTLKDLGDTVESNSTSARHSRLVENNELVLRHIKARAATIRVGAIKGWRAVPNSEVHQDFRTLGADAATASHLASAPSSHAFRGHNSNKSSGGRRSHKKKSTTA